MDTDNQTTTIEAEEIETIKNLKILIACSSAEEDSINKILSLGIEAERFELTEPLQNSQDAFSMKHLKSALEFAQEGGFDSVLAIDSQQNKFALAVRKSPKDTFILLSFHQLSSLLSVLLLEDHPNLTCEKSIFVTETINKIFERAEKTVKTLAELVSPLNENSNLKPGEGEDVLYLSENQEILLSGQKDSLDYLIGRLLSAEIELHAAKKTLFDKLMEIYQSYGFRKEKLMTGDMSSPSQKKFFTKIMDTLKKKTPEMIGGSAILSVTDMVKGTSKSKISGRVTPSEYPEMNAVKVFLSNGVSFIITPAGEKIIYFLVVEGPLSKKEEYPKVSSAYDARMVKFIGELNRV